MVLNIRRCVNLALVFDFSSFYFSSLADEGSCQIRRSIKQDLRSRLCSLNLVYQRSPRVNKTLNGRELLIPVGSKH